MTNFSETKTFLQSKTVWGAIIALLGGLLSLLGYQLSPDDAESLVTIVSGLASMMGSVMAIIGRISASKRIR